MPGILILHITAGMNFANKDSVRHRIYKKLKMQDQKVRDFKFNKKRITLD